MKKTILFLLLLLAGNTAFAQNYAPLPDTGIRRYFTNSAGYLRGIRVDSVVQEYGYKRYVTFRTARGWKNTYTLADSNGACWIGKNVRAYANGDWHFPNITGDTILVKTGAKVGDTWVFHRDTSAIWTEANVLSVDTQTVFGVLDSVKIIQLTLKNGMLPLLQNPISAFQVVLSKTMGFAQVPDLYLFPYKDLAPGNGQADFWYRKLNAIPNGPNATPDKLLFTNVIGWNPTEKEMYNFGVGDVIYYSQSLPVIIFPNTYYIDTVIARQDFPTYTDYTYNRWQWKTIYTQNGPSTTIQHGIATVRITDKPTFESLRMPEEYFNGCYEFLYLDFKDSSLCDRGLVIKKIEGFACGLSVGGLLRYTIGAKYKKGLGLIFYSYANGDGASEQGGLYGYLKNGVACGYMGTVPSGFGNVLNNLTMLKLYPLPATTEVFLDAPQLRYPATIRIQNLQGQLLSTQKLSAAGKPISTANLPAGLYLISVTDANGNSAVQKLLIEAN